MSTLNKLGQLFSKKALSLTAGVAVGGMMLGLGAFAESASAVTIGDVNLSDDGFATAVFTYDRDFNPGGNFIGTNGFVEGALTDQSVDTFAFSSTGDGYALFEFANPVLNAAGKDIALFDLQASNTVFRISADFGQTWFDYAVRSTSSTTNTQPIYNVFVAEVDLSDFMAEGAFLESLIVDFNTPNSPALALVGSIQRSTPEPSAMFGLLATVGFLAYQRRSKLARKA